MDRSYNNARPLYGEPDTNWVRVIYSARTVSSRLPLLTNLFERYISHDAPRSGFDSGYGNFLNIHYLNRRQLPKDEPDGCEPDVSPFEIATQSWETYSLLYAQTHDAAWLQHRDQVEKLAQTYKPRNIIDLNWDITFLATIGGAHRSRQTTDNSQFEDKIKTLIDQLYSYERPNGQWPYHFDANEKASDFITFHAIYALAVAGRRPEADARLARAVDYCLKSQRIEGDWQGDPVYKGFNTPFRDTQFAVMALSTLYPERSARGPKTNGDTVRLLRTDDVPHLLWQLDQFWDLAPEPTLRQIRSLLSHSDQPLVREAAARALGHMADPGSVDVLIAALGDPTKMVQRTAAWALRQTLSRRPEIAERGRGRLAEALRSPNARVRWGATRVFSQHFKYLAVDPRLLSALIADLADPVPMVRWQAANGLWRWYYWQVDRPEVRDRILATLAGRLSSETDAIVRRGLQESIYNILDENIGYLTAWTRTAAGNHGRQISDGYQAVVRGQAQVLARELTQATRQGRLGILHAMWDFHSRHMALPEVRPDTVAIGLPVVRANYVSGVPDLHRPGYEYAPYRETVDFRYRASNGFYSTRIGNDTDLIRFFRSSGPELENALIACLQGADSEMKIEVLKAGSTLQSAGTPRFALAALRLSQDPDPAVRQTVQYVYENGQRGTLNIDAKAPDAELAHTIAAILSRGTPEGQAVLLPMLAALPPNSAWQSQPAVVDALRRLATRNTAPDNHAAVLNAVAAFPRVLANAAVWRRVQAALSDSDPNVQRASIRICLKRLVNEPQAALQVKPLLLSLGSSQRGVLLEEVANPHFTAARSSQDQNQYEVLGETATDDSPDLLAQPIVVDTVLASLSDSDANVRAAALDLLARVNGVEKRRDFQAAVARLQQDANPRLRSIARHIAQGKSLPDALADLDAGKLVDYDFFVDKVQPILARTGVDGMACVICHQSHAIFKLRPPSEQGHFSSYDSRENFEHALRVIDVQQPERSLILIKPTRPTDAGGDVSNYLATHNGGQRWKGNESSEEYKTILEWIRGAKANASAARSTAQHGR